ncbi:hypothetical protein M011DRAFT_381884, partial [Sporormia fimetaria CBS 119925]
EYHVVISTGSGGNLAEQFYNEAVSPVLKTLDPQSHSTFHVHRTQSETSILDLTKDVFFPHANDGKTLRIFLLSGDGGVVDIVNGLMAQPISANFVAPQVVLLPLGTANALYHSIHEGRDHTWGLKTLASDDFRALPIFKVTFSPGARLLITEGRDQEELPVEENPTLYGAVVCSWGLHAAIVADSDSAEFRKFGIDRFKMAAKEALYPADGSAPHAYKGLLKIYDGSEWVARHFSHHEHLYVLATTVSRLEKTFTISPATKPLDGTLHLVHFAPTTGDKAMEYMNLAYQGGKHIDEEDVSYVAVEGLRIEFKEEDARWRRICVDGKIVQVEEDGFVEMRLLKSSVVQV